MRKKVKVKSFGSADPETIMEVYDGASSTYDETRLNTTHKRMIDETERDVVRRHLGGLAHVLEVGAGTGRLTNELVASCGQVTAIDISEGMLSKLRQKIRAPNLIVRKSNLYDLPQLPGYGEFDGLLCMRVLPHLAGIEQATGPLQLLKQAVKPGGILVFDMWNRHSYRHMKKDGSGVYNHYVSFAEVHRYLGQNGLKLVYQIGAGVANPWGLNLEFLGRTWFKRFAFTIISVCSRS